MASTGRAVSATPTAKHGFNDAEIEWRLFNEGVAEARKRGSPILLLAHTTWCPHCRRYKAVFFDREVVMRLQSFTPILLDRDLQGDLSKRYAPDGNYVPRTMALTREARLMAEVVGPNPDYLHFLPYDDPRHLIEFLDGALSWAKQGNG